MSILHGSYKESLKYCNLLEEIRLVDIGRINQKYPAWVELFPIPSQKPNLILCVNYSFYLGNPTNSPAPVITSPIAKAGISCDCQ
ncbi:hypothetical protein Cylst_3983 [Cylindrospermum stagnale PCC 7417]|uniref:Uncharacterized protein n=1 Tax=Cylindrospermum stagnale PCC 7417 TaxID=56107 RepID=K9X208_9NOST|nr:hypothetical protein Cylst_3983 [Cylindrospermum stagnale PCC 7417]